MQDIDQRYLIGAAVILLLLTFSGGVKYSQFKFAAQQEELLAKLPYPSADKKNLIEQVDIIKEIEVYIGGAVENPMICKLTQGCRVYQAIEMAGKKEDAALEFVDMARILQDGETIIVPRRGQENFSNQSIGILAISTGALKSNNKLNINKASISELDKLPGIGPALADRIFKYREANGAFSNESDICNVNGIGEKKYADIKDLISVK